MIIALPSEIGIGERRVALVPDAVRRLVARGLSVRVASGAGQAAWFSDNDYRRSGATVETSVEALLGSSDLIIKIHAPSVSEVELMQPAATLFCLLYPRLNLEATRHLAQRRISALALENFPRSTLAQAMDVLSSQSTAAGYRAVIAAANGLAKFFPMLMTPAGTIAPAHMLVLGAGVAGLQAIATARRLGAAVEAFDVRRSARDEVRSLGAKFIELWLEQPVETAEGYARQLPEASLERVRGAIRESLANADVCITSALVSDQPAPILITGEMVRIMRPGSVIVDLAAEQGGNCELTEAGRNILVQGVTILGRLNFAAEVAMDASRMYSFNIEKLIGHFFQDGIPRFDCRDEITRRCLVTHAGEIVAEDLIRGLAATM